jgi:putative ABC transport system permease protein
MNNTIKIILRNLARKPFYSLITFTGFSLGIVSSLLIYLWIRNELSYEKFHPEYNRIYRVLTLARQGDQVVKSAGCYRPVAKTMKMDYPQIEFATFISYSSEDSPLKPESGGEKIEARMCWSDDDFFKIFRGFRFLEGTPESAFDNPDNIVLSEKTARKLFGDQSAIGKTLISDKYDRVVYTVGAVVRIPEQSHIDFGFMLSEKNNRYSAYSNNWGDKGFVRVYIKLAKDAKIDNYFLNSISNHLSRYSKISDKLVFQPIADIHLYSDYENDIFDKNPGNYRYVWIFSGLAFLIIIMASLNFSVLSVARASERSVEIGIRKASGAGRAGIFRQFLAESVFQTFSATLISLVIVWFILPWFNRFSSNELSMTLTPGLIASLFLLTFFVGLISGIYPSFYLSAFNPAGIFRGGSVSGSKSKFIRILVTIQFSIAIFFIIATSILIKQLNYIHNKDLGYDGKNIVVFPTGLWYGNKQFKEELLKNPSILSVSASVTAPVDFAYRQGVPLTFLERPDTLQSYIFWADEDFAETYNLQLIKGEFLRMDNQAYWDELNKARKERNEGVDYTVSIPTVINETAEKMLGIPDPLGKRFGDNVIVGVVRDFNFRPLQYPVGPLMITNNPEVIQTMNVKIASDKISESLDYISDVYKKYRDDREFSYSFFDDLLAEKYRPETRLKNITLAFAILAIMISSLGILGMVVFSIDRRTKEIGIRRVTGANASEITILLNSEFVIWVIVSFFVASPLAWLVMHKWLRNFAYKTDLSWWVFGLAGLVALGTALLTITWQSWRAATRNPVETLRYE